MLPAPGRRHGLFTEFKTPNSSRPRTPKQLEWADYLLRAGYQCDCLNDLLTFESIVKEYLDGDLYFDGTPSHHKWKPTAMVQFGTSAWRPITIDCEDDDLA